MTRLSKQEILKEIAKCGLDPVYFIKNYCKITHPDRGRILFDLYPFQENLIRNFTKFRYNSLLKARQIGASTTVAAYIVWLMFFYPDKFVLVIATQFSAAANVVKKVKIMLKSLPSWFEKINRINIDNQTNFSLTNGSEIKASATNETAGRSDSVSLLVIDEAAHVDNMSALWTALKPTLATGGKCIALSTPNGASGWFFDICEGAKTEENDWKLEVLDWRVHPDRDGAWEIETKKDMSPRAFEQEFECSFLSSGQTLIDPTDIQRIFATELCEPIAKGAMDRNLWFFEDYDANYPYMITVDAAKGDGGDNHVFDLWKLADQMEQVAQYQGNEMDRDSFSQLIYDTAMDYGQPMIVVENATFGDDICKYLINKGYTNIYWSEKGTGDYVPHWKALLEDHNKVSRGFTVSPKNRSGMYYEFERYVRTQKVLIRSSRTYAEIQTFVWWKGKPQASTGKHDDTITTCAIACYVKDTVFTETKNFANSQKVLSKSIYKKTTSYNDKIKPLIKQQREEMSELIRYHKRFAWVYKG